MIKLFFAIFFRLKKVFFKNKLNKLFDNVPAEKANYYKHKLLSSGTSGTFNSRLKSINKRFGVKQWTR